jgi:1,4-alpha-glucan branching enzyme
MNPSINVLHRAHVFLTGFPANERQQFARELNQIEELATQLSNTAQGGGDLERRIEALFHQINQRRNQPSFTGEALERRLQAEIPSHAQFASEIAQIRALAKRLDPAHPHAAFLSASSKADLQGRIEALFGHIQQQLRPSAILTPQEMLEQRLQLLNGLKQSVNNCTPYEFYKQLKRMDPGLTKKIYEFVWMASGCPKPSCFSSHLVRRDTEILRRQLPSLVGGAEGPLLDQVVEDLKVDFQLSQYPADAESLRLIENKAAFFLRSLTDLGRTHTEMKGLFHLMPACVQAHLAHLGTQPPFYGRGMNFKAYLNLGAHYDRAYKRTTFRLFAPHASQIELHLTFRRQLQHKISMQKTEEGVWTATVNADQAGPGRTYHFMVTGEPGSPPVKKVDPFAFQSHIHDLDTHRINQESKVFDLDKSYTWSDQAWMNRRRTYDFSKQPLMLHEVHVASWRLRDGRPLNWRQLAVELSAYCKEMNYNCLELMGMFSHPQPKSMGYQITNFFAPHPEMGTWEDFQFFVNHMHTQNIGVWIDWAPAHFALDSFALGDFDGKPLFEDDEKCVALHPKWGTYSFDFKKKFARDFLASNLDFMLRYFHIDGVRVDAVSSMIWLNYDRVDNDPGKRFNHDKAGDEAKKKEINLPAKAFLRNLNAYVHKEYPGVQMIAEESSGFDNLTRGINERGQYCPLRGFGFDYRWHMNLKDKLIKYLPDGDRKASFGLFKQTLKGVDFCDDIYPRGKIVAYFSHDENANGNGTFYTRMFGNTPEEKFANVRLFLSFLTLRGGGPILDFMGTDFAQEVEWHWIVKENQTIPASKRKPAVQWGALDPACNPQAYQWHLGAKKSRQVLNRLFLTKPGLWDQTDQGLIPNWVDEKDECVLSFHRKGGNEQFLCVFNTSGTDLPSYELELADFPGIAALSSVEEVYNTDDTSFGGRGRQNRSVAIVRDEDQHPTHLRLHIPPYTALLFEEKF